MTDASPEVFASRFETRILSDKGFRGVVPQTNSSLVSNLAARQRGGMKTYRCEAKSVDAFLSQVVRLIGTGHYFYFQGTLKKDKDPRELDRKLIREWDLDKPSWKREARRRGAAPNIHYLRFGAHYVLMATHGKTRTGEAHRFFLEYKGQVHDIRKNALRFCGYSIRYPISKETGRRRAFVRLEKESYERLRASLLSNSIRARYREPDAFESIVRSLPFQWYKPVRHQVRVILKEVNRARRHACLPPVRLSCVPTKMRVTDVFVDRAADEPKAA
jgi:hypothetical protein